LSRHGFSEHERTSKIVSHLVDLTTDNTLSIDSIENPQILYSEDIITRITFAMSSEENFKKLHEFILEGVCAKAGINPSQVYEVIVVGNTAMHHFFLGIQARYLALSPFVPVVKSKVSVKARELGVGVC